MGLISLDSVVCDHCQRTSLIRRTTFEWPESDPKWKRKDDSAQAFSCPVCKHVYMIQALQQGSLEVSQEQLEEQEKVPAVFSVPLQCDDADCEALLLVLAPRSFGTSVGDIERELPTWTLHDLLCSSGHPVSKGMGLESGQES